MGARPIDCTRLKRIESKARRKNERHPKVRAHQTVNGHHEDERGIVTGRARTF